VLFGVGELCGYLVFDDGCDFDLFVLLLVVDVFLFVMFDFGFIGWVLMLYLSVWVWVLFVFGLLVVW